MSEPPATTNLPVAEDPASARIRRWNRFQKILMIFLAGWASIILEKIVKLDSVLDGLKEGGVGGAFIAPFLLIITLPLARLGSEIGSRETWRKYRPWFTYGLPALFLLMGPASALYEKFHPEGRFEQFTGVAFPRGAEVQRCTIDDGFGPLYDPGFVYELTCSAAETDRLIRELKLNRHSDVSRMFSSHPGSAATHSKWVDEIWSAADASNGHAYELRIDATRTKIWLMCAGT